MKNVQKTIAMLTVTGLLLGAAPSLTAPAAAAPAKTNAASKASALNGISANLIKAAQAKLKEVTGKTYTFSKADKWTEGKNTSWVLQVKEAANSEVDIFNDKVAYISVVQKWADLKDTYKQQINAALKLADAEATKTPETVTLTIGYTAEYANPGKLELFASVGDQFLTLLDGKAKRIMSPLQVEEVPESALQAADKVAEGLNGVKKGNLLKASVVLNGKGEKSYELQFASDDANNPIFINLKEATGQITKVELSSLEDSSSDYTKGYSQLKGYTEAQLLKNASPQALKLLNIDLTGYKAAKDKDHPGSIVFTKTNAPTVKGTYNTKGQFYNLELAE
ncbi:hypothetical protein LBW89_09755 [Paenibacillus sp. alder61]|uniref:PepSY domain-containing protein n=1 Tax=Paenibacillus faecis TaxID=862114 RepID=A0A5D0CRK5_9BACL|nr:MULTISPECIES: hypothetical protein [Paenibacillus]MCA1293303.1 hypothetical protein [Paenibacillus sp. alder61]TYA12368.1 hypothetical protein FRY98_16880 [Paenibacillus faecis]